MNLDLRVDATNALNHVSYTTWNTTVNSTQFGLPAAANAMRSVQTTVRLTVLDMRGCYFHSVVCGADGWRAADWAERRRDNGAATFTAGTQMVVETVVVKDKSGDAIQGLTAKDFTVTEDGARQTISFSSFSSLPEHATPIAPAAEAKIFTFTTDWRFTKIAPEFPGTIRYRDRRLLALYFDMTAMPPKDQMRALAAAREIHPDADDAGGSDGHPALSRRSGAGAAGFHRTIATGLLSILANDDRGRRPGVR